MVTAFPDDEHANQEMGEFFHNAIKMTGLSISSFDLWDNDKLSNPANHTRDKVQSYDVIILGGGHVPTQQRFFEKLGLRDNIRGFEGIVIGISAGSMNCADIVYAQPEEPGEATDPNYKRFIRGLGLTDWNVLPHYQLVRDNYIDGQHLFNDVSIPDSDGHRFVVLVDGSYIYEHDGEATVYGEAYLIENRNMYQISEYCVKRKIR